jgi:hypothetical protein
MPDRLRRLLPAALVVLAASIPYLPTIDDYFVQDDFGVVWLLSRKAWSTFPRWFVMPWTENIWEYVPDELRPFPALSYQIAAIFGAGSPVANHVINIGFHAVNALLVFWIAANAARLRRNWALVAALIFAVMPIQAESVAWVTGRVDSMPACFYFAAFATYVRWRTHGGWRAYLSSLLLCFVALFTKQNTITLGPALVLYDLLVERRPIRFAWAWVAPYLPFAALTASFLALRYALFGAVAREEMLTGERVQQFLADVAVHLKHLVFGEPGMTMDASRAILFSVAGVLAAALLIWRANRERRSELVRIACYFGIVWLVLGIGPILVAGYRSPRHVYLASLGWAVLAALALQALADVRPVVIARRVAAVAALAMVAAYGFQLTGVVRDWGVRAGVSRQAVSDIEREALAMPEGTLILTGAPARSWEYAIPHALRPPFTSVDLTGRVTVISRMANHCCAPVLWDQYTRQSIRQWLARPRGAPIVALYWNPTSGALSRLTEAEEPYLRPLTRIFLETPDRDALDGAITRTLTELVAPHRR